jgi:ABC-type sugar transport system ATPase subunit
MLEMIDVSKRFGSTHALRGVDLILRPGEVQALVGENGAGKSTLMKILSGAERPDGGSMLLGGKPYKPSGPLDARRLGVAMIYQELTLAPHLSVEANILLGQEPASWGVLQGGEGRRRVREALALLEHSEIQPESPISRLSPALQQVVEIARAMLLDVRVLVLDEPTSSLNHADVQRLFALIRRLRDRGASIVYISHFLEEVKQVADRFTVLRDGRSVGGGAVAEAKAEHIIEMMVGRRLTEQFPRVVHSLGQPVLQLDGLKGEKEPRGVSLTLRKGEILGIAGIVGAGRTELLRAVFGLDPVRSGRVIVLTHDGRKPGSSPHCRIEQGLGFLSEDRKHEGLALIQSIADNLTYSRLRPYSRCGWLNLFRRGVAVREWLQRLRVRCRGPGQPVGQLSGGNQQKVAFGRLMHQEADVLLLDEPTKGVDVGSKAEIYQMIGELAARGKAILFVSSNLPELLGVCDTLAVMTRGRISRVRPAEEWTAEQIMAHATGDVFETPSTK